MTRNPRKFCILGASFNTSNLGVGALAAGIITSILAQHPDAEISFMDYAKQSSCEEFLCHGKRILIEIVNIRFSKKIFLSNNIAFLIALSLLLKLVPFPHLRHWLAARNRCLKHLQEVDVVGAIAGGDSFSDIYGLPRFFYVALPQILALLSGQELVLLPQTIGPFDKSITRFLAKQILRRAHRIFSRDEEGLKTVRMLVGKQIGRAH